MQNNELYEIAFRCAELNANGCAQDCMHCQYNIYNYVSDVREGSLLLANATTNFHRIFVSDQIEAQQIKQSNIRTIVTVLVISAVCLIGMGKCVAYVTAPPQPVFPNAPKAEAEVIEQVKPKTELQYLRENQNKPENISRVLAYMNKQGVKDKNRDGKVNCIDYSMTFRELYGDNAKLIINKNDKLGMNHMFIQVVQGARRIDVEPQGTPEHYAMNAFWGMKYEPAYNKDVTSGWGGWVGH